MPGFHAALHNGCSSVYSRYPIVDTRILFTDRNFSVRYCDVGVSEIDCGDERRIRVAPVAMNWQPYGATMPEHGGLTVPWEVSTRLAEAGFADTFRAINPDPVRMGRGTVPLLRFRTSRNLDVELMLD